MPTNLTEKVRRGLERLIRSVVSTNEGIEVKIRGRHKEVLVCTDTRVLICKSGLLTGNAFGSNVFQSTYENISGVDVRKGIFTSYLEISTGGMQNTPKTNWTMNANNTPRNSPNCVSLTSALVPKFQDAASFIMEQARRARNNSSSQNNNQPVQPRDLLQSMENLWALHKAGALNQQEFEDAKRKLLAAQP
jgi:hypothetical protein